MKKALLWVVALILLIPVEGHAIKLKIKKDPTAAVDYSQWVAASNLPDQINGIPQFYPVSESVVDEEGSIVDTTAVINGCLSFRDMTDRQIFLAALVYASENFRRDENFKEGFEAVDFAGNKFVAILKSTQGSTSAETTYTRNILFSVADGSLCFRIYDIDCRFRDKGIIPRTLRLERLHPEKNSRHEELVREVVSVNSGYLAEMKEYISGRKEIGSPNYDKLMRGSRVELGMNEDEVTILLGPPMNRRKSGERLRWIYANDFVIIFTDGVVTKIVE